MLPLSATLERWAMSVGAPKSQTNHIESGPKEQQPEDSQTETRSHEIHAIHAIQEHGTDRSALESERWGSRQK